MPSRNPKGRNTMAAAPIKAKAGSSLPADIAAEVAADWATDDVKKGDVASEVRMPFEALKTFRSNRAYDCLEVARAQGVKPPKPGMIIGSKTWVEGEDPKEGEDDTRVLVVQTFWKVTAS